MSAVSPGSGLCAARLTPTALPQLTSTGSTVQTHVVNAHGCGGAAPLSGNGDVLVANAGGSRAAFISGLKDGQHVSIGWRLHPQWPNVLDTTGSNTMLVQGGRVADDVVLNGDDPFYTSAAPRTAVGRFSDGREVLVTVDGRQPGYSVGVTPMQLAEILLSIGVTDAANLDGGGSTTLTVGGLLVNRPSDAAGERPVGTALVVVAAGSADPPPFAGAASAPPPEADAALRADSASLGGFAASRAARGVPLPPELAEAAQAFAATNPSGS
jgi:hypothetical protein